MGAPLFAAVRSPGGARGTHGDSETCRWQIEQSSGVPTVHPITILAESYRRADVGLDEPWHRIV